MLSFLLISMATTAWIRAIGNSHSASQGPARFVGRGLADDSQFDESSEGGRFASALRLFADFH